jgi:hypothetical protein
MGCDIHIDVQVQEPEGWRSVSYQRPLYEFEKESGKTLADGPTVAPNGFDGRNYDLFALLADVRNGRGFAGIKTGAGWPSIAPDRGFPEGYNDKGAPAGPYYATEGPRWMGEHSFTFVALDELERFDWDGVTSTLVGVVDAATYEALKGTKEGPDSYCTMTSGPGIVVYSPDEYEHHKREGSLSEHPHVRMFWVESARSATYDWPGKVLPWLRKLAAGRPLRLVLGFDS